MKENRDETIKENNSLRSQNGDLTEKIEELKQEKINAQIEHQKNLQLIKEFQNSNKSLKANCSSMWVTMLAQH